MKFKDWIKTTKGQVSMVMAGLGIATIAFLGSFGPSEQEMQEEYEKEVSYSASRIYNKVVETLNSEQVININENYTIDISNISLCQPEKSKGNVAEYSTLNVTGHVDTPFQKNSFLAKYKVDSKCLNHLTHREDVNAIIADLNNMELVDFSFGEVLTNFGANEMETYANFMNSQGEKNELVHTRGIGYYIPLHLKAGVYEKEGRQYAVMKTYGLGYPFTQDNFSLPYGPMSSAEDFAKTIQNINQQGILRTDYFVFELKNEADYNLAKNNCALFLHNSIMSGKEVECIYQSYSNSQDAEMLLDIQAK